MMVMLRGECDESLETGSPARKIQALPRRLVCPASMMISNNVTKCVVTSLFDQSRFDHQRTSPRLLRVRISVSFDTGLKRHRSNTPTRNQSRTIRLLETPKLMAQPMNKVQDLFNVNGMVIVISGGGSGLGLYAARAFDANGAKAVYIIGRRETTLQDAAKTGVNGTIKPIVGDVTNKGSLIEIVDQIKQEEGFVNLLFANAGVSGPKDAASLKKEDGSKPTIEDFQNTLWQPEMDQYTKALHVNCTGVYYTVIAFLGLLDAGNKRRNVPQDSQVLVTSSIAGFSRHLASSFAYSTSKAACNHLVKMLSTTFAQNGFHIRVNLVAPGLYPSEMTQGQTSQMEKFGGVHGHDGVFEDASVMPAERSPAERTGSEQDFAGVVLFMASRAGAYLNGETTVTDGGRLAQLPATY